MVAVHSSDGTEKNRLCTSIRSRKVWEDTFEICDICESDINLPLNIRFTGEEAVDHGWSKITKVFRERFPKLVS